MEMIINDNKVNFSIMADGRCLPKSGEILEQVGLAAIAPKIDRFYESLGNVEPKDLLNWVAYEADLNVFQAKARLIKYLLLDGGCRMCEGETEEIRVDEFVWLKNELSMLEEKQFFTFDKVAKMLNQIGFQITLN